MYRFSPLGFSSRDGQVENTAYMQSQQEIQQRQMFERTAQAELAMMQAAREAQIAHDAQKREAQDRQNQLNTEQHWESQRHYDDQQTRDRYVQELFRLTAPATNQHADTPHPELTGASSGNIHSNASLMGRDWAALQNATQPTGDIPTYHTEAPVITYRTDISTDDMMRAHNELNQVGQWSTNNRDIDYGHISPEEAKYRLSLFSPPSHVSDVSLPIGTFVTASRPDSGAARQYNFGERIASWFSNSRPLG